MAVADLNQSVKRLAFTLETIRAEVSRENPVAGRSGLSRKLTEGAGMTKAFALELSETSETGLDDVTFRLFTLRQGEIIFTLLSKVLAELGEVESRLDALEHERSPA